jgi:hypothetical protein
MKRETIKRWRQWHHERLLAAESLLRVWFYEMQHDHEDGTYDCTCEPGDPCPMHRVAEFLGENAGANGTVAR